MAPGWVGVFSRPSMQRAAAIRLSGLSRRRGLRPSMPARGLRHSAAKAWCAGCRAYSRYSCVGMSGGFSRRLLVLSAPVSAMTSTCGPLPGCTLTKHDPAFAQIVRRHFYVYAVSNDRTDTVATHLSCRIADDAVLVIEGDAETSVRQDLVDRAFHRDELFFRQTVSLAYAKPSARTYSVAEP